MINTDVYNIEKISRGESGIWKIYEQFQAAMYLVCGKDRACLIDTAFGLADLREVCASLTDLPVFTVNTHGHEDHVLGNHWFDRAMIHPADRRMYEEIAEGFAEMAGQDWVQEQYGAFLRGVDLSAVRFPPAEVVLDGDVIDLGGKKLDVIGLPGHTPGSIVLIDREEKICFAGDAVIEHLWMFLDESLSPEKYLGALQRAAGKMAEAGVERIYNGHYAWKPLTPADVENMIRGMEAVCAGTAQGKPFENDAGKGVEYSFGDWSVLCKENLPSE